MAGNPLRQYVQCSACDGSGSYIIHAFATHRWVNGEGGILRAAPTCPTGYPTPIGAAHVHGQCTQYRCGKCDGYGMVER